MEKRSMLRASIIALTLAATGTAAYGTLADEDAGRCFQTLSSEKFQNWNSTINTFLKSSHVRYDKNLQTLLTNLSTVVEKALHNEDKATGIANVHSHLEDLQEENETVQANPQTQAGLATLIASEWMKSAITATSGRPNGEGSSREHARQQQRDESRVNPSDLR